MLSPLVKAIAFEHTSFQRYFMQIMFEFGPTLLEKSKKMCLFVSLFVCLLYYIL